MEDFTLLIVDDDRDITDTLKRIFRKKKYRIIASNSSTDAVEIIRDNSIDCAIVDLKMPGIGGLELLEIIKRSSPQTIVIILTAYGSIDTAVEAMKKGASNFYEKPFNVENILANVSQVETIVKLKKENAVLREEADFNLGFEKLIGISEAMTRVKKKITDISVSDAPVLITGETGSGKEIAAKAVHTKSRRKGNTFITVDCAALPESLMESELFGHTKGSFTGANSTYPGLFMTADNGTLFLDEIGEIPMHLQSKLLRAIQEQEVRPVGALRPIPVNIRIIAATNRNLEQEIKVGRFREDLFYRLNVVQIEIPPLRERRDDIVPLVNYMLAKYSYNNTGFALEKAALDILSGYNWPGNVRELENVMRRAMIFAKDGTITASLLAEIMALPDAAGGKNGGSPFAAATPENDTFSAWEKAAIINALNKSSNNRYRAAEILDIGKATLYRKIKEYQLDK